MPLADPPGIERLTDLPGLTLRGLALHRVYRANRSAPWWFASLPPDYAYRDEHGRFDLPYPGGACYLATSPVAAVLEAFQHFQGRLPDVELAARRRAEVIAPPDAPTAADLAAPWSRGAGVTAALWAGQSRRLSQAWAAALRHAGWLALHHGISHDPAGQLRAVTLFDRHGQHPPYGNAHGWAAQIRSMHDDAALYAELRRYGIEVTRADVQLPIVPLALSSFLEPPEPAAEETQPRVHVRARRRRHRPGR
jgi:hypothetical protein